MTFNLIHEKWIWVQRQDGTRSMIAPWQITDEIGSNPIVSLDEPRHDFNGSMIQFLIGLVQTTMSPKSERDWRKRFTSPPTPEELLKTFENVSQVFELDGDNGRFMQDHEHIEGAENRVDALLMEMPGAQTIKQNTDHFQKRDTVARMCLPCSATALFNLQLNAPAGGQGHRTSLRGGGPLTTLVKGSNLWQTIWLNVISDENFNGLGDVDNCEISDIYPWMGPTRTSEKKDAMTTPMDVNPKQMYWGMPRRIRLNLDDLTEGACDVCGCDSDKLVSKYVTKNYGYNYDGGWCHVLSPHNENKNGLLPRHPQPGGITYRHWLGLVQHDPDKGLYSSLAFERFVQKQKDLIDLGDVFKNTPQLWAFGYDFDNMKVRCWYESTMPLFNVSDEVRPGYEQIVSRLVKTAEIIGYNTRSCVKKALFGDNTPRGDLSYIDSRFWHDTEPDFYNILNQLMDVVDDEAMVLELKMKWHKELSRISEKLFDDSSQSMQFSVIDPERAALAHKDLRKFNSDGGKKIRETLGLPEKKKK
ncbi:type I-E CRISPR-associated protein Cse1/CasA [Methanococcoides sp.]|uniref:type I-E CRISPR-associated protein Cse1/CasA n=1 Tax=Methanococcoides sp. TaxID=1966350 RepID=UPI00272E596F|nr:type I-E CRISPR-associated protein Cse1/CasA [Methanococcoides sp.]